MLAMSMLATGCASSPPPVRIALFPAAWQTDDPLPSFDARAPIAEGLERGGHVEVENVRPAPSCAEDPECVRRAGRAARASRVVLPVLASLGQTVLARLSVIDVAGGTAEQTQQRVVNDVTAERVAAALEDLGGRVAEPLAPRVPDWYEEPWPWVVGGIVLAGAAALALGLALTSSGGPDHVVVPP